MCGKLLSNTSNTTSTASRWQLVCCVIFVFIASRYHFYAGKYKFGQEDVAGIVAAILPAQTKSEAFGHILKIPPHTVEAIHQQYHNPQDRLFHVISEFVKHVEPKPTWKVIVEALKNPLIEFSSLAEDIENKYNATQNCK